MSRTSLSMAIGMAFLGIWLACSANADADKEASALAAAKTWLALVDKAEYDESWDTAASYFKGAITKDYWNQSLTAVRKPLGTLVTRELKSKTYAQSLPGAPDGEYVVIQFNTSFGNKQSAIETVTPMLDTDGIWRVAGYYIK